MFCKLGLKMPIHSPKIGVLGRQNRVRGDVMLMPPHELVLTFGGCYLCATFSNNRSRNATVRVHTDRQTNTRSDRDKLNL